MYFIHGDIRSMSIIKFLSQVKVKFYFDLGYCKVENKIKISSTLACLGI
jgi:hypothetical protein